MLIAESIIAVVFESSGPCRVSSGRWIGPYTGMVVIEPGNLDIDHVVSLANAHHSGGWAWSREQKEAYANDLDHEGHLTVSTSFANRSKGSDGPEDWRPPDTGYWCNYAVDWVTIKQGWGLSATEEELNALQEMLATCVELVQVDVTYRDDSPSVATPVPTKTSLSLRYDPNGPDRNCDDFDTWPEVMVFYKAAGGPGKDPHKLDRDGDGIPCESLPGIH